MEEKRATFLKQYGYPRRKRAKKGFLAQGLTRVFFSYNVHNRQAGRIKTPFACRKSVYKRFCMKKGFTLIELLVVVLIIGILSAVALPQYTLAVEKSRVAEAMPVIKNIANAREIYQLANGSLPHYFSELDIAIPGEEDDDDMCRVTKNWSYCIDVNSTDAARNNVSDENYYVISYYLSSDTDTAAAGHFTCFPYGELGDKICRSLGGKKRGGSHSPGEYILP